MVGCRVGWIVALLLTTASPTSVQDAGEAKPASGGEAWPAPYTFIHDGFIPSNETEEILAALPFDRIELQRTACLGDCPSYTVTLHRNGKAEFVGSRPAPRTGKFAGGVDPFDYGRLCFLLESQGFESLSPKYTAPSTCRPTTYLRVWRDAESAPITVEDYGGYGPIGLWGMQAAVDAVSNRIDWKSAR